MNHIHHPGTQLYGYTVRRLIAEGGQGRIYEVQDPSTGAIYALKKVSCWTDSVFMRAQREAHLLAELRHPALITCRRWLVDQGEERVIVLVLDYVQGTTLQDRIHDPRRKLKDEQIYSVFEELAVALEYIHGKGIVHRDVTLANVLIGDGFDRAARATGHVKLIDFGIAIERLHSRERWTDAGRSVGVLPYIPPEEFCPDRFGVDEPGFRRDIFAVGVLIWRLLFEDRPPTGFADNQTLHFYEYYQGAANGLVQWPPRAPRPVSPGVMTVLHRCLALYPRDRLANGGELLRMLRSRACPSDGVCTGATPMKGEMAQPMDSPASPAPARRNMVRMQAFDFMSEPTHPHARPALALRNTVPMQAVDPISEPTFPHPSGARHVQATLPMAPACDVRTTMPMLPPALRTPTASPLPGPTLPDTPRPSGARPGPLWSPSPALPVPCVPLVHNAVYISPYPVPEHEKFLRLLVRTIVASLGTALGFAIFKLLN